MQDLQVSTVEVSNISVASEQPQWKNLGDVQFKVSYKKDYEGTKPFADGEIFTTSKESAEHFEAVGIGSLLNADEPATEEAATETVKSKKK